MGPWQYDLCPRIYKCLTHRAKLRCQAGRHSSCLLLQPDSPSVPKLWKSHPGVGLRLFLYMYKAHSGAQDQS